VGPWALSLSCIPGISSSKTTFICTAWSGGALCAKSKRWIPCKDTYLFNQEALSPGFFVASSIDHFRRSAQRGNLNLEEPDSQLNTKLYKHKWIVSVRDPILTLSMSWSIWPVTPTASLSPTAASLISKTHGQLQVQRTGRNNILKQATLSAVELSVAFSSTPASGFRQNPPLWLSG